MRTNLRSVSGDIQLQSLSKTRKSFNLRGSVMRIISKCTGQKFGYIYVPLAVTKDKGKEKFRSVRVAMRCSLSMIV